MGGRGTRAAGRTGPVTAEAVIDAALAVIDGEGLDALTMRRLAHDLGVEPVTIYRQLPNKEAILAGVAEKLWLEMAPPEGAGPGGAGAATPGAAAPGDLPQAGDASPPPDWRAQVRAMWLALNGLMQRHPNAIPIIARGGSYSASAGEGTEGMLRIFKDAGLSPEQAAELLHILSACVVGFGFATLWGRQMAAAQERAAGADEAAADAGPVAPQAGEPAPPEPDVGDLTEYVLATRRWDPAQFTAAVDIVLGAYGDAAPR